MTIRARLATFQGDPEIGDERIVVYHEDGRTEQLTLHDYARIYALPGVYEEIVSQALGCRSPAVVAELLGAAVDALGHARADTRVIDLAAGNGLSGEALREAGMVPVLGTDIEPAARDAALRDRPGVYAAYETLDLSALGDADTRRLADLHANALICVSPVGMRPGMVPPAAIAAGASLLTADALVVVLHDPRHGDPEAIDDAFWAAAGRRASVVERRRYLHRFTVTGAPYELDGVVWHLDP